MGPRAYHARMLRSLLFVAMLPVAPALAGPAGDARQAEARGDRLSALDAWRRAIEENPEAPEPYVALGRLQIRMKDPNAAVSTFEQLVERVPGYARGRYRLAFALRKSNRYPDAARVYRVYAADHPDDPDACFGLAESLRHLGDREGALEAYRKYVELESRPSEAKWVRRANAEIARLEKSPSVAPGRERALEPEKKRSVQPPPGAVGAGGFEADRAAPDALFAKGDYAGAASGYRRLVESQPEAAVTRYRLGLAAGAAGDLSEAERGAAHAERLDPGNPAALDLATIARARRLRESKRGRTETPSIRRVEQALNEGRVRTAERLAAAALAGGSQGKERGRLLRLRADALVALGRMDEGLRALKAATARGEPSADTWLTLGEVALAAGDHPGARYYLELAVASGAAENPAAQRARARLAELPKGLE